MRRKILQDFANTLCQILVGWRMGDDLEILSDLPDGLISIDILNSDANHSITGKLDLYIAKELSAWLEHRLSTSKIDKEYILSANIEAQITSNLVKTNRKKVICFSFDILSTIETDEKTYQGRLQETHKWHTRISPSQKV